MFVSIGVAFIVSQCLVWPKEFRGGVFNKLSAIALIQQENESKIDRLDIKIDKLQEYICPKGKTIKLDREGYVRCVQVIK